MFYRAYFKNSTHIPFGALPILSAPDGNGKKKVLGFEPDKNNQVWLNPESGNFIRILIGGDGERSVQFGTAEEKIKRENGVECFIFSDDFLERMELELVLEIGKKPKNPPKEELIDEDNVTSLPPEGINVVKKKRGKK